MVTSMSQETLVLHSGAPLPALVDDFLQSKVAVRKTTDAYFFSARAGRQTGPKWTFFPCRGGFGGMECLGIYV